MESRMRLKDVYRQREGKWCEGVEVIVLKVGDPEQVPRKGDTQESQKIDPHEKQKIDFADSVGVRAHFTYYVSPRSDGYQDYIEKDCEGKKFCFNIKHKNGMLTGRPCDMESKKDEFVDWEAIAFGKCRTVITKACIHSIEDAKAIEASSEYQATINNMAYFCMNGITE